MVQFIAGFCLLVWSGVGIYVLAHMMHYYHGFGDRDDTDTETKRSGVALVTDYGTGRQYLMTFWGGLTPRLPKQS